MEWDEYICGETQRVPICGPQKVTFYVAFRELVEGIEGIEMEQTDDKEGMTAEELIEELQKVDPESLVQMEVEINGISCWIGCSSVRTLLQQKRAKCNFVILEGY